MDFHVITGLGQQGGLLGIPISESVFCRRHIPLDITGAPIANPGGGGGLARGIQCLLICLAGIRLEGGLGGITGLGCLEGLLLGGNLLL